MKYIKQLLLSALLVLAALQDLQSWTDTATRERSEAIARGISWAEVVDIAKATLPLEGELVLNADGFIYLNVDDDYIHQLLPMLDLYSAGFRKPPYFRRPEGVGAHISVFYAREHIVPDEIGQTFKFELDSIVIVQAGRHAEYVILQVKSPELEALRRRYGLNPLLLNHEFHITLGKKRIWHSQRQVHDKEANIESQNSDDVNVEAFAF